MTSLNRYLANITLLLMAFAMPAYAASSAASSASDSIATSVGSVSGSIQKSSGSSSKANASAVADGDYRIIEVTAPDERPGMVRMKLQARAKGAADREFFLTLPQKAFDQSNLAPGDKVTARKRPYGADFANAATREVFFLVLDDERYRELRANAVVL